MDDSARSSTTRNSGPGMIKTVITLRTGNAWVHAIAPHLVVDTPLIAKIFGVG